VGGRVRFWDMTTHKEAGAWLAAHPTAVIRLAFSPDGKTLATGGEDGLVKLWDVADRRERRKLKGQTARITLLTFSRDGQTLASASDDGSARLWDGIAAASSGEARSLEQPDERLMSLAYSPDGKLVATAAVRPKPGGALGTARVWDLATGQVVHTLPGPAAVKVGEQEFGVVTRVAFSPDGRLLATGGSDSHVLLWDVKAGEKVRTLVGRPSNPPDLDQSVGSVAFSPDGKILAAGFGDPAYGGGGRQIIKLWEVASGREIHPPLTGHRSSIHSLVFAPDGKTLASASLDRTVKLWNTGTWKAIRTLTASAALKAVAFSPDGTTLAAGGTDGRIQLWDAATGHTGKALKGHSNAVIGLVFSADGKTLVSTSADKTVKLWDVVSGRETRTLTSHTGTVSCVAFSPDGSTLATGSADGTLRLWDAASPAEIAAWEAEEHTRQKRQAAEERQRIAQAAAFNARGSGPAGIPVKGNLLVNGSFEQGPNLDRSLNLAQGSRALPGWLVSRGTVDLIGTDLRSSHGKRCLDLNGTAAGGCQQVFATVPGRVYRVTFDLAGQPYGAAVKQVRVTAAGQSMEFAFDISGRTSENMGWVSKRWQFTADSPSTTLEFYTVSPTGPNGPVLDNIAVLLLPADRGASGRVGRAAEK
jgi:choice-of-anchor C domain-containing protein